MDTRRRTVAEQAVGYLNRLASTGSAYVNHQEFLRSEPRYNYYRYHPTVICGRRVAHPEERWAQNLLFNSGGEVNRSRLPIKFLAYHIR